MPRGLAAATSTPSSLLPYGAQPAEAPRIAFGDDVPAACQLVPYGGADAALDHQTTRLGGARVERRREAGGVPGRRVDRLLQVHPAAQVTQQEEQLPLVLLVATRRPTGHHRLTVAQHQRRRQRGPRSLARRQRGRQPVLEPEHLRPAAQAEPELRDRRRRLQPATTRRGGDDVAPPVDHVDMAGVPAGHATGRDRRLTGGRVAEVVAHSNRRQDTGRRPSGLTRAELEARRPGRSASPARRRTRGRAASSAVRRRRRRTRPRGRRTTASSPRPSCAHRRRCPGRQSPNSDSTASDCNNPGPWPHGPVLATVYPFQSTVAGSSQLAWKAAMSSPVTRPPWSSPLESRCGSRENLSTASATNPSRQAFRACSICACRSAPAASPSVTSFSRVAAYASLRNLPVGGRPSCNHSAADVGQCSLEQLLHCADRVADARRPAGDRCARTRWQAPVRRAAAACRGHAAGAAMRRPLPARWPRAARSRVRASDRASGSARSSLRPARRPDRTARAVWGRPRWRRSPGPHHRDR